MSHIRGKRTIETQLGGVNVKQHITIMVKAQLAHEVRHFEAAAAVSLSTWQLRTVPGTYGRTCHRLRVLLLYFVPGIWYQVSYKL